MKHLKECSRDKKKRRKKVEKLLLTLKLWKKLEL